MNYRQTMLRLNTALAHIDATYADIAKKEGLTFNALMTVCLIDEAGDGVTQKQICEALHLPKSTVHSILQAFSRQGYILVTAGSNKKEKMITFTDAGRQYFAPILSETHAFEDNTLAALGDEACTFLVETAERLGDIIEKGNRK